MSDIFSDVASQAVGNDQADAAPSQTENQVQQSTQAETQSLTDQAIFNLDKTDKFTFGGREWTRDALGKLIDQEKQFQSMQGDYTKKTQALAQERKALEEDKKFRENLAWDLMAVKQDPSKVQEFIKVYPQSYHRYIEDFLKSNSSNQQQTQVQQQPQVDVRLMSKIERLEKFYNEQEIARESAEVEKTMAELSKDYPDAAKFQEMVLSRAYEARLAGSALSREDWEQFYKQVDDQVKATLKQHYGEKVKQQLEANAKGKDVGAGGGTAGRAPNVPPKFKSFDEIQKYAEASLKSGT
jgi:hypothetical protein